MSARVVGVFSTKPIEDLPRRDRSELRRLSLDYGFIAHDPAISVAQHDGLVCVAWGSPQFGDQETEVLGTRRGCAAAWMDAFRRHADEAPTRVRGRFAVVLIEAREQRVRLVSDRFGTWPLCFGLHANTIAFSDRADTVPMTEGRLSHQALFEYAYFHMIPAPRTAFEGVERLSPATLLSWTAGSAKRHAYWIPRFDEPRTSDLQALKEEFRETVRASVAREAAGHSVGAFLSGGTDSSTVAGMLCNVLGRPARTYSIGFDAAGYDEMGYARIAAKHFHTEHHEHYITPADLLEGIPRVATHFDQPFGNSSAVPAWICARLGRADGVDKMLAGDGGDELFGGNTRYAKQRVFSWYDALPRALRTAVIEPVLGLPGIGQLPLLRKGASYVRQAQVAMPDRAQLYNLLMRLGIDDVFTPGFLARIVTDAPLAMQRDRWRTIESGALINRMLAYDWKFTLADNDLPKVTVTADLAGVDIGFPLLCDELVEFSLRLPPEWKLKRLQLRWFFKEALRGFLPEEIIAKKKHGFGLPFGVWAVQHEALGRLASDALDAFGTRGVMQPAFLRDLTRRWLPAHPGYYGEMVWIVMMMEKWMQAHAPDWRFEGG